jgi:hypothetical protein
MKYLKKILPFLLLTIPTVASAHLGGSFGDHGSYVDELLEWPPHLRQLHYYGEVGAGLLIVGFLIVGITQRLKAKKH